MLRACVVLVLARIAEFLQDLPVVRALFSGISSSFILREAEHEQEATSPLACRGSSLLILGPYIRDCVWSFELSYSDNWPAWQADPCPANRKQASPRVSMVSTADVKE